MKICFGPFFSLNEKKRQFLPDGGAVFIDSGAEGWDAVGIHGFGDGAVLGIGIADGDILGINRLEDGLGLGGLQGTAGDVKPDFGGDTAAVHHACFVIFLRIREGFKDDGF